MRLMFPVYQYEAAREVSRTYRLHLQLLLRSYGYSASHRSCFQCINNKDHVGRIQRQRH